MAGWHHWLDGREFEWTPGDGDGQGGLECCDSWGRKVSDMTEWLNWTELNLLLRLYSCDRKLHPSLWHFLVLSPACLSNICHILIQCLEKAMATHSSTLAWKIPWTKEPGRLQSMGSRRVERDRVTSLSLFTFMHWRRKWQPTLVFLPGRGSLVGWRLRGHTESDTTEAT